MSTKLRILHHLTHGLGDAVQFTSVLRHLRKYRPDWHNHVVALLGKHTAYRDLADSHAHFGQPGHSDGRWYHTFSYGWFDYPGCHDRYPSTKVVNCLIHELAIEPDPELLSYQINVGPEARQRVEQYLNTLPLADKAGFVVLHYQGNTSPSEKNLSHPDAQSLCAFLSSSGYLPLILDWDRRTPLADNRTIFCPGVDHPLWRGWGTGDAETMAALIDRAAGFVGIDSGPQKVAMSRAVPSVGVWTQLHPVNYADLCATMTHLVPRASWQWIKGPRGVGWDYFRAHYDYQEYDHLARELCEVVAGKLKKADKDGGGGFQSFTRINFCPGRVSMSMRDCGPGVWLRLGRSDGDEPGEQGFFAPPGRAGPAGFLRPTGAGWSSPGQRPGEAGTISLAPALKGRWATAQDPAQAALSGLKWLGRSGLLGRYPRLLQNAPLGLGGLLPIPAP